MKKITTSLTALTLGSALVLAGCAEDTGSSEPATETTTVVSTEVSTEVTTVTSEVTPSETTSSESTAAAAADQDFPVTVTDTGFVLGDEAADNNVTLYQDFNCPHCKDLHAAMDEEGSVAKWIEDGASVTVIPVNYLGPRTTHDFSGRAANAMAMVANNHPEHFMAAQEALYKIRPETTTAELDDATIEEALTEAGIELTDADKAAIENQEYKDWVDAATDAAAEKGVNYIPQVWVNDELKESEDGQDEKDFLDSLSF